jgi:hypothetical protein
MIPTAPEPEDRALDAMIESLARVDAPRGFAARVSAALDERDSMAASDRLRVALAASVAVVLVVIGAVWFGPTRPPLPPAGPPSSTVGHLELAPSVPIPAGSIAASARSSPGTNVHVGRLQPSGSLRVWPASDHERALPALVEVPAIQPRVIEPYPLAVASVEIEHIEALEPLVIQSGRTDSGPGDFR